VSITVSTTLQRLATALADRYRIERELGAGGMATVYLAHDIRHERDVAIKVLHPDLGAALGGERFLSEIRTTARLQHPHILPLLDSGEADTLLYYVMPLVRGETLRSRLERERQLPIDDALRIAREVADALQHAHAQGIVHRDIKPENILLQDGHALVADFGIALAVQQAGGQRMTQTGLSLGTPQYMSPEQAMGERTIDARSDVYALGAVTYEMLVGEAPFTGPSVQAIVARVLTEEPRRLTVQRKAVPDGADYAVLRALEKLPADRFESAKAFAEALGNSAAPSSAAKHARPQAHARRHRWSALTVTLTGALLLSTGVATWALLRASDVPRDIGLEPTAPMGLEGTTRKLAVAHDGSFIIYEAKIGENSQLWWQSLRGGGVRAISGTEGATGMPRLSPDDQRVAFVADGELRIVGVGGGAARTVARVQDPTGGGWLPSGQIFFADEDGRTLRWVDPENGAARTDAVQLCHNAQALTATHALCGGGSSKAAYAQSPEQPTVRRYLRRTSSAASAGPPIMLGSDFRVVDSTYLVYMAMDGTLSATRFDSRDSLTVGKSVALVPGVRRAQYSGTGQFDLTDDGTLVYLPGINADVGRVVRWSGTEGTVAMKVDPATHLRFSPSPDGTRLGTVVEGIQQQEMRIYDLNSGTFEVVEKGFFLGAPGWSPDGRRIAYRKQEFANPETETVYLRQLDSPDAPRVLVRGEYQAREASFLADDLILLSVNGKDQHNLLVNPAVSPVHVDTLSLGSYFIALSPDRRWIAYALGGTRGLLLQPWPALDKRYLIDASGNEPVWRSPTELLYTVQERGILTVKRVTVNAASANAPMGRSEVLIADPRFTETPGWSLGRMPGGGIAYVQSPSENLGYYVRVIPNWVRDMKRAVDAANR
jgi:eukaryotic-like serine/threonine-protein kinase